MRETTTGIFSSWFVMRDWYGNWATSGFSSLVSALFFFKKKKKLSQRGDGGLENWRRIGRFSLGIANSGALRIAERNVERRPGTSGLTLPGYSSRYLGLMVSMWSAMRLLLEPLSSYVRRNQSLNTARRFIISACWAGVTWLPRCLDDVRWRYWVLEIGGYYRPVPSYDFCDERKMAMGSRVLPSEILETLVCGEVPAMAG